MGRLAPNQEPEVSTLKDSHYGIYILVEQGLDNAVSFNINEQRWAYNANVRHGRTKWQINRELNRQNIIERQEGAQIYAKSIHYLLQHISRRIQCPPQDEIYHWKKVMKPYDEARGDRPTVRHEFSPPPQPVPALAAAPPPPDVALPGVQLPPHLAQAPLQLPPLATWDPDPSLSSHRSAGGEMIPRDEHLRREREKKQRHFEERGS